MTIMMIIIIIVTIITIIIIASYEIITNCVLVFLVEHLTLQLIMETRYLLSRVNITDLTTDKHLPHRSFDI